ncbi:MAG: hypothetical protein ACREJ2_17845 [Planctomycetota bacterium]
MIRQACLKSRPALLAVLVCFGLATRLAPLGAAETALQSDGSLISPASWFNASPTGWIDTAIGFQIRIGAWLPQTRSDAKTGNPGDSRVIFSSLDVKPKDAIPEFDFNIDILKTNRLRVGYWSSSQEGTTTLGNALQFNGQTFPSNTNVKSTVDLSVLTAGYEFMLLDGETFRLGLGIGADFIQSTEKIEQQGGPLSAKRSDSWTIPFVSAEAGVYFGGFGVFGSANVMEYGQAYMVDGRVGVSYGYDFPPGVSLFTIGGGVDWRVWDVHVDYSKVNAEWTQQGLEVFGFFRF